MKFIKCAAIGVLALGTMVNVANARWGVDVNGPDVFGETSVKLSSEMRGTSDLFLLECSTEGTASAAWLVRANSTEPRQLEGRIIFKSDTSDESIIVEAESSAWNDNYFAFVTREVEDVIKLASVIGSANSKIAVGLLAREVDLKVSGTISARGSTKSVETFFSKCDLERPE